MQPDDLRDHLETELADGETTIGRWRIASEKGGYVIEKLAGDGPARARCESVEAVARWVEAWSD